MYSLIICTAVLAVGAGAARVLYATREVPPRVDRTPPPPLVNVVRIERRTIDEKFVGFGSAVADRSSEVAAEVSAQIIDLPGNLKAGDVVDTGQVLVQLDSQQYELEHQRATARAQAGRAELEQLETQRENIRSMLAIATRELEIAAAERDRVTQLYESNDAAKREFDLAHLAYQQARRVVQAQENERALIEPKRKQLEANVAGAEHEASLAKLNVERCAIQAPYAGAIDALYVERGDHVAAGTPVARIVDASIVEIAIQLPASRYPDVVVGARVALASEAVPSLQWRGEVVRVSPTVDRSARVFSVYVEVDNREQPFELRPGTFVRAEVQGPHHEGVMAVPRSAIRYETVLVAEEGRASRRNITIQRYVENDAIVAGEVEDGELLITSHLSSLEDGNAIRVRQADSTSSPSSESRR